MESEKRNDAEFESIWTLWRTGKIDLTAALRSEALPEIEEVEAERYQPQADRAVYLRYVRHSRKFYNICATLLCVVFAAIMLLTVGNLPRYGSADAPTNNEVVQRYVEKGTEETGAVNTVAGMILDYRAFDTLGESFVLFTSVCAVTILMKQSGRRTRLKPSRELVRYADDPIVRSVCKFIFPIIMIFGVYILLNGHLSPGGGFSGGAVLGAGLIIYAMVWGEEKASHIFREKLIKIVTLCSLGFYCLAKSYSFFTGANHLHSIVSPGTPGRIFSAGLILPLNVAVGLVVCCTMYSFYMYFRRGKL
jgi:multisubunit Na+/H+ antiporter MnhB subunit